MVPCKKKVIRLFLLVFLFVSSAFPQKIKVIVDQDARGPGTSDQQAILVFLQSEKFDVLGITTVSGDQWVREETQHVLRLLEIANRTDVPVIQGAEFPLLNSKEETERWEALYGKLEYKGCWTERFNANRSTIYDEPYHPPEVIPPMKEGSPHIQAAPGTAAEFIIKMVHKYPGEVVLWAGGPLTNYALALKLDPEVATLAKEFVLMGGGLYARCPPRIQLVVRSGGSPDRLARSVEEDDHHPHRYFRQDALYDRDESHHSEGGHSGHAISGQVLAPGLHVGRNRRRSAD